ncbi:MAG: transglycosylase SLT domain-containing protein [Alphaproteobacteria bacterium]|nr:transglycosylase SLT domain-containing protein [Alphaproteobacteria bacterium]
MSDLTRSVMPTIPRDPAIDAVARGAAASGADFSALLATARRESALNPSARAGTSSAAGLFQFIESTWLDMVRRHGADHGLGRQAAALQAGNVDPATRRAILDLRFDPELSARMAGELWRENAATLSSRLGRAPSESELYAAHVMGPTGAARLIDAAATGVPNASALFPREAAANRGLFYTRDGAARSAQGLLERLSLDVGASAKPAAITSAPSKPMLASSSPLSPALLDALFALTLPTGLAESERD